MNGYMEVCMKILIVDDEQDIRNLIKIYLTNEQYEIVEASNGEEAVEKVDDSFDLVLMDVMMPKLNGVEACHKIRENYKMPILFLTAKGEDADKLTAFSFGADDYIVKPFNPIDLVSRVKANIRRYREYNQNTESKPLNNAEIKVGDLVLNTESHIVNKNDEALKLTKKEFAILSLFFRNRGRVFSLEQIYELIWDEDCILNAESTVSVHIRNLREKIEDDISNPKYIITVWGVGYRVD